MDTNEAAVDNAEEKPVWEQLAAQSREQRTLVLDDGSKFVVPADLLGMHSSVLRKIFYVYQRDDAEIKLPQLPSDVFELFLKTLCGLRLNLEEMTLVCPLAHRFMTPVLIKTCDDLMFTAVKNQLLSAFVPLSIAEESLWLHHCDRYINLYSSLDDFMAKNSSYKDTVKDAVKAWVLDRFIPDEAAKARHYDEIATRKAATDARQVTKGGRWFE